MKKGRPQDLPAGTNRHCERVLEVGARLEQGPSERLIQVAFKRETEDQAGLFEAMNWVDLAHTLVMIEAGIVPQERGRELICALLRLGERPADFTLDPARGDLYTNREAWLAKQTAASTWLGAGRARREATTTSFLIKLRSDLLVLAEALTATGRAVIESAYAFRTALMPDYTYLQSAQPTTFGHYLLGFAYPMARDLNRIQALFGRVNRSPAGCGSTNGSRLPQDRQRLRELLGFDGLVTHARDAMWQADLPIETAAILTGILVNLDRLAEDLQIYATEEFGLIELDDSHARASKIMPQKKNPFALTHVRGVANTMIGTLAASAAAGRTPSGQPDNRLALYGTIPRAITDTQEAIELMGEVVRLLRFNMQRGRSRLDQGFVLATDLAEVLVLETGLDFRQAHRLVGYLVRTHGREGSLKQCTPRDLAMAAEQVIGHPVELSETDLRDALNPEAAVFARTAPGGAAPEAIQAMITECAQALAEAEGWVRDRQLQLRMKEETLLSIASDECSRPSQGG